MLVINYAIGADGVNALRQHSYAGGMAIDPLKNTVDFVEPETLKWARIHGVLMSAAFGLLMPLAILSSKHKWLFNSDGKGDSSSWFCAHVTLQVLALGLFAGGAAPRPGARRLALRCVQLRGPRTAATCTPALQPWPPRGHPLTPSLSRPPAAAAGLVVALLKVSTGISSPLFTAHKFLGFALCGTSGAQLVMGLFRPGLTSPSRPTWARLHALLGWLTQAGGWVNLIMGILLVHGNMGEALLPWLIPICLAIFTTLAANTVMSCTSEGNRDDPPRKVSEELELPDEYRAAPAQQQPRRPTVQFAAEPQVRARPACCTAARALPAVCTAT